jgi:Right handed beta helix region
MTYMRLSRTRWRLLVAAVPVLLFGGGGAAWGDRPGGHGWDTRELHVAAWGRDSWPGTASRPFRTLERAQRSVRAGTRRMRLDIVVSLHPGTHTLEEPLRLSDRAGDSGENGHRVIYQAHRYGTDRQRPAVVSGGRKVTGWRLDDPGKGIWRAKVGDLETRQLYVDGVRARRARLDGGARGGLPGNVTETEQGYVTDSTAPQSWDNAEDIELVYHGQLPLYNFSEPRCGVADISGDADSTTITMDQPCYRWFRRNHTGLFKYFDFVFELEPGPPSHVENSTSFLTEPGTFYLDRSRRRRHVLYYIPRPGEDLRRDEVVAPVLEQLVDGQGRAGAPLHDVTFRGLTFSHATWMEPSESTGFSHVFGPIYEAGDAGQDPVDPWDMSDDAKTLPGNVRFRHSRRIVLEDNRFTQLGADALELSLGTSDSVVRGNVFTDISGAGVTMGNRYPHTDLDRFNRDNLIANNWVHGVGAEYLGSVGIYAEKTQGVQIVHNQVNDVPYTGIVFGEFWTHYPAGETTAYGNRILNNRIFDVTQLNLDGGGIWTAAVQGTSWDNGSLVAGNLVHDTDPRGAEIYGPEDPGWGGLGLFPDDDSSYITWRDNIVYRSGDAAIGGCPPLGHLLFTDNFLDNGEPSFGCEGSIEDVVVTNTAVLEGDPEQACAAIPACATIAGKAGLEPAYRRLLSE